MPADIDSVSGDNPAAVLIAVPDDAIDELVEADLVGELPTLRGPVFDVVVTVGMDSAAIVTLMQTPDAIRAFAAWVSGRVRRKKDGISITANRGGRSLVLDVNSEVPVEAVTDFLLAALSGTQTETSSGQSS